MRVGAKLHFFIEVVIFTEVVICFFSLRSFSIYLFHFKHSWEKSVLEIKIKFKLQWNETIIILSSDSRHQNTRHVVESTTNDFSNTLSLPSLISYWPRSPARPKIDGLSFPITPCASTEYLHVFDEMPSSLILHGRVVLTWESSFIYTFLYLIIYSIKTELN